MIKKPPTKDKFDYLIQRCTVTIIVLGGVVGIIYPMGITVIAKLFFSTHARQHLVFKDNQVRGSLLIGQKFSKPEYFWGRPSATDYQALPAGSDGLSLFNPLTLRRVSSEINRLRAKNIASSSKVKVPTELVTQSSSGVDPHVTPDAIWFQLARVARARHVQQSQLVTFIKAQISKQNNSWYEIEKANVLLLNLALDETYPLLNGRSHKQP